MGHLIINHSGLDKKPGTKWGLHEMRTTSCVHCQGLIVHFTRGCTEYAVSSMDLMAAILSASDLPSHATKAAGCSKCRQLICRNCEEYMEKYGCPGPAEAQAERLVKAKA